MAQYSTQWFCSLSTLCESVVPFRPNFSDGNALETFLRVTKHLFKGVCPSDCRSVIPSVLRSVRYALSFLDAPTDQYWPLFQVRSPKANELSFWIVCILLCLVKVDICNSRGALVQTTPRRPEILREKNSVNTQSKVLLPDFLHSSSLFSSSVNPFPLSHFPLSYPFFTLSFIYTLFPSSFNPFPFPLFLSEVITSTLHWFGSSEGFYSVAMGDS